MKKCQFCGAEIQEKQVICPVCFRYTIPELDPHNMRVYSADGREFGPHLSKEQQGIRNPAFEQAFRRVEIQPQKEKYCRNCGEKLPADARFCGMCGTACPPVQQSRYAVPDWETPGGGEKTSGAAGKGKTGASGGKKKLFVLIAVLAAVVLLLAGILAGVLLGGSGGSKADPEDEEEETRDRDEREKEAEEDSGKVDSDKESGGTFLSRTNTFKLVENNSNFQSDVIDSNVCTGYNDAGQLIVFERRTDQISVGYEQYLFCEYTYDAEGNVAAADLVMDDQAAQFTYAYEDGKPVSCTGTVDGETGSFLFETDEDGNILSVSLAFEAGDSVEQFLTASYDAHGCLVELVAELPNSYAQTVYCYNCDGKQTSVDYIGSSFSSRTENRYDESGRLVETLQYMNNDLISSIEYVYSSGRKPVLEAMVVSAEDMVAELPFTWDGNTGVCTPDPELTGGMMGTVTVTVDDDGDLVSTLIEADGTRMESSTTYITLELPAGETPSRANSLIYLHNVLLAMAG